MTEARSLHDFTEGVAPNPGGLERLRARFEAQRVDGEGLLAKLQEEETRHVDFVADTRAIRMVPVPEDVAEGMHEVEQVERLEPTRPRVAIMPDGDAAEWYGQTGPLVPNVHAHGQLAQHLRVPRAYYRRLLDEHPDILSLAVNRHLDEDPRRRMFRCRLLNGDSEAGSMMRAYVSDKYRRLDALPLCNTLMPLFEGGEGWALTQAGVTDLRVHLEAIYPNLTDTITVGDEVALAVKITTSDVGAGALTVQLGFYRLVCSNLAVVPSYTKRRVHIGGHEDEFVELLSDQTLRLEDKLVMEKMRDVVRTMADPDEFRKLVGTVRESAGVALPDPIEAAVVLARNAGLADDELHAVQGELVRGGNPTMWGLTNALTAVARNLEFERKAELEVFAGAMVADNSVWTQYTKAAA